MGYRPDFGEGLDGLYAGLCVLADIIITSIVRPVFVVTFESSTFLVS